MKITDGTYSPKCYIVTGFCKFTDIEEIQKFIYHHTSPYLDLPPMITGAYKHPCSCIIGSNFSFVTRELTPLELVQIDRLCTEDVNYELLDI